MLINHSKRYNLMKNLIVNLPSVWVYLLILLKIENVSSASNTSKTPSRMWSYNDETTWPGRKCQSGGWRQSPIDINTNNVIYDFEEKFIRFGKLKFIGYNGVLMTGINNGLTVQFSTDGDQSIHPIVTGGPLQYMYRLEQMHFHWLSEHAINGRKYPMEIHLVHVRADLSVSEALTQKDGLCVVAIFGNVKAMLTEEEEDRVAAIMDIVQMIPNPGNRASGAFFNLKKLLLSTETYYTYAGSLTSPECNEVVTWIVLPQQIWISDDQYRTFGEVGQHNFRSLQPIKDHVVYQPKPLSVFSTPYLVNVVADFFGKVSGFFRNITRFVTRDMLNIS